MLRGGLEVATGVERMVIRVIRHHLEQLDPPADTSAAHLTGDDAGPEAPSHILRSLLDKSVHNLPDDSRSDLHRALLKALLPDEARILAALSDGTTYPLIHIAEAGPNSDVVLANASTVGRVAGVSLPDHTPLYLTRMVQLGLVIIGPEGPSSMNEDYELLLTESAVNAAQAKARRGIIGARIIRRTVGISKLGQEMWDTAK